MLVQLFLKLPRKIKVKPGSHRSRLREKERQKQKRRAKQRSHLSRRQRKKKLLLAVSWISIFENILSYLSCISWSVIALIFFYSVATPGTDLKREYNNCTCAMDLPKGVSSKCFSFLPFICWSSLAWGNELRTKLNTLKVELAGLLEMVKDMDYDNLPEDQYHSKMESVKEKLGECKLIRAQAKAVLRELVPWHICT